MSMIQRFLIAGLLATLAIGCGGGGKGGAADVQVDCQLDPQPPREGPTRVALTLTGGDGQPIRGAKLRVEGNMNHAGMKPVFGDAREVAPGRYQADIELTMGGDWFLLIEGDLADGRRLERKIDVPGVAGK